MSTPATAAPETPPTPNKPVLGGEPLIAVGTVVAVIMAVLSIFHVTADIGTVTAIATIVVPVVTALLGRFFVTPVAKNQVGG